MQLRHIVFGVAISVLASAPAFSATSTTNTNTNTNTNTVNSPGFGSNSFTFSNGNVFISQTFSDDSFCQSFHLSSGLTQTIVGNVMTQFFGSPTDPFTDPCQ